MGSIAVLTPTIPGREELLAECKRSVAEQTLKPREHLIGMDIELSGQTGWMLNALAGETTCEWLAPLADDDLFLPHHLERLSAEEGDIIHSRCRVEGRGDWMPNFTTEIPAVCLIRRSLWRKLGGWSEQRRAEDGQFFERARKAGATFTFIDEETWVYRFGLHANKSLIAPHHSFREAHEAASRVHE